MRMNIITNEKSVVRTEYLEPNWRILIFRERSACKEDYEMLRKAEILGGYDVKKSK